MASKTMVEAAKDHLGGGVEEASRLDMDVKDDGAAETA